MPDTTEKKKELPSYTIGIAPDKSNKDLKIVSVTPEERTDYWYRQRLDREKDGLVPPEIMDDMLKIGKNLTYLDEEGNRRGRFNNWIGTLSPNPKPSELSRSRYITLLRNHIMKKEYDKDLLKFKNKDVLVYIVVYLGKKRYSSGNDVDNIAKPVLDALKLFIGDDAHVVTLIVEKKCLPDYPKEDLNFIEQVVACVTDTRAKAYLFNE